MGDAPKDPRLDHNQHDPDVTRQFESMPGVRRVSFCCVASERLLPFYKVFRSGQDPKVIDAVLAAGWACVRYRSTTPR